MKRYRLWIVVFYALGFTVSIAAGFLFRQAFCWIENVDISGYTVTYFVKRVALSVSAGVLTFQVYTDVLRFLLGSKGVPSGEDDRRWLMKFLQDEKRRLKFDEIKSIKKTVTALPAWFKFVILYAFALLLALL